MGEWLLSLFVTRIPNRRALVKWSTARAGDSGAPTSQIACGARCARRDRLLFHGL